MNTKKIKSYILNKAVSVTSSILDWLLDKLDKQIREGYLEKYEEYESFLKNN